MNEGGPVVIEPFQRLMLADYFAGRRSTLILISKKNGKTTLLAALAVFHLLSTPDAECVIAAASRDQAGLMLKQIRGMIRRSSLLRARLEVTKRTIVYADLGGQVEIRASDVDTLDGVIPTLGLIDALDRHKAPDVYGVIRDGLGPRNGKLVAIATAGDDEQSTLGQMKGAASRIPGMVRRSWPAFRKRHDGVYRYVATKDFAFHEWALNPDDDRTDLELVKSVNPASWQTLAELKKRRDDPSTLPYQWARFACGVWAAGDESAISEREWGRCARPGQTIAAGEAGVVVGVDLATKWDTTAFVPIVLEDDGNVLVGEPDILEPPQDGTSIAYEDIFESARSMAGRYPGCRFVLDPTRGGEQLAQEIDGMLEGCEVVTYSQDARPMSLAAERTITKIAEGELEHPDNPTLNRHVLSAAAYHVGDRFKFVKRKRRKLPIDGLVALAMAISSAVGELASKPTRETFRIEQL